jgi:hypothetical protein
MISMRALECLVTIVEQGSLTKVDEPATDAGNMVAVDTMFRRLPALPVPTTTTSGCFAGTLVCYASPRLARPVRSVPMAPWARTNTIRTLPQVRQRTTVPGARW